MFKYFIAILLVFSFKTFSESHRTVDEIIVDLDKEEAAQAKTPSRSMSNIWAADAKLDAEQEAILNDYVQFYPGTFVVPDKVYIPVSIEKGCYKCWVQISNGSYINPYQTGLIWINPHTNMFKIFFSGQTSEWSEIPPKSMAWFLKTFIQNNYKFK